MRDQTAHLLDIKAICRALVPPQASHGCVEHVPFIAKHVKHPGGPMRLSRVPEITAPSVEGGTTGMFYMLSHAQSRAQK